MDVRRQKRERDSDLSSSPLQDTTMFGGDSDSSKKAKTDGSGGASRVVHIRNIVTGVSETEVIQLCMPFGTITNLLMMKQKNQAFVEFEKENAASVMINYFSRRLVRNMPLEILSMNDLAGATLWTTIINEKPF